MRTRLRDASAVLAAGAILGGGSFAVASTARVPAVWKSCSVVNKRYPHGIGKARAHDSTSGTPVTTFKRSNYLYGLAMRYNRGLDRDRDGIACEKL